MDFGGVMKALGGLKSWLSKFKKVDKRKKLDVDLSAGKVDPVIQNWKFWDAKFYMASSPVTYFPALEDMWDRLMNFEEGYTKDVIHISSPDRFEGVVDFQKGSTQLPVMSKFTDYSLLQGGVATGGGIIFRLNGKPVLEFENDVWSELDTMGIRWVSIPALFKASPIKLIKYSVKFLGMRKKIYKELKKKYTKTQHNNRGDKFFKLCRNFRSTVLAAILGNENPNHRLKDRGFKDVPSAEAIGNALREEREATATNWVDHNRTIVSLQAEAADRYISDSEALIKKSIDDFKDGMVNGFQPWQYFSSVGKWNEIFFTNWIIKKAYIVGNADNPEMMENKMMSVEECKQKLIDKGVVKSNIVVITPGDFETTFGEFKVENF